MLISDPAAWLLLLIGVAARQLRAHARRVHRVRAPTAGEEGKLPPADALDRRGRRQHTLSLTIEFAVALIAGIVFVERAWSLFSGVEPRPIGYVAALEAALGVLLTALLAVLGLVAFAQLQRTDRRPTRWPGYQSAPGEYTRLGQRALDAADRTRRFLCPPLIVVGIAWIIAVVWS